MKVIKTTDLIPQISQMISAASYSIEEQTLNLLQNAHKNETAPYAKEALDIIIKNDLMAKQCLAPACQDTGIAVFFVKIGCQLTIEGNLTHAINEATRQGYRDLRKSTADPLTRQNIGDNTPAVIHYDFVDGDKLTITYLAKGAGSENMSKLFMLTPADGVEGIISSAVETVRQAGANPCPPIILGIGIGGTMDKAAVLSKYALTRPTATPNQNTEIHKLEQAILAKVNALNIGAQGLGGGNTALAVHIETTPTHIGMLPVAINIQCHSVRHKELII